MQASVHVQLHSQRDHTECLRSSAVCTTKEHCHHGEKYELGPGKFTNGLKPAGTKTLVSLR